MILEIHGVANAERPMAMTTENQRVTVTDRPTRVRLELSNSTTADMTPEQARMVAKRLFSSATRVEQLTKERDRSREQAAQV